MPKNYLCFITAADLYVFLNLMKNSNRAKEKSGCKFIQIPKMFLKSTYEGTCFLKSSFFKIHAVSH